MKFYAPSLSLAAIAKYYSDLSTQLDASLLDFDAFCQHVGRKPAGSWALFPKSPAEVVWVPRALAEDPRAALQWLETNRPPHAPWKAAPSTSEPQADHDKALRRLRRYYGMHPVDHNDFPTFDDFVEGVGLPPGPGFTLTRMDKNTHPVPGTPLARQNFVWITPQSVELARQGELAPPRFPNPDPQRQAINDHRFSIFVEHTIKRAQAAAAWDAQRQKWESDLALLLDQLTAYVVRQGHPESAALDPTVLKPETHPKLNRGRQLALDLMRYLNMSKTEYNRHRSLEALNATKQANRDPTQRVYQNKPGRPLERFVQKKVRIADLTHAQRVQYNLPLNQDFIRIDTPKRRGQKVWTTTIMVPNPRLAQDAA